MSFEVRLAGVRATTAHVVQPARGVWSAVVELDEPKAIALGAGVQLVVGDLTLEGTVVEGGASTGTAGYHVVGGRGGWRKVARERSERQDKGVKLSAALKLLAADVGEEWTSGYGSGFTDRSVGYLLVRPRRVASQALHALVGRGWYVGDDGKTVLGDRPTGRAVAEVLEVAPIGRTLRLAAERPSKVRPGMTLVCEGRAVTIERVVVEASESSAWLHATYAPTVAAGLEPRDRGRLLSAVRAILRELSPRSEFSGDVEYSVQAQNGAFVDLRPVNASLGMPMLSRVHFRGAPGVAGTLVGGTRVLVRFVDSDPGRPYVAGVIGADDGSFLPTVLRVDAAETVDVGESATTVNLAGGAEAIPLAPSVETRLQELASAILTATPTPNDGGAAIQTAAKAVLQGLGWGALDLAPPSTASQHVRGT